MKYDPRAHGAKCDECPLRDRRPIPPEKNLSSVEVLSGIGIAIVGDAPGLEEDKNGRLLCGSSGSELESGLRSAGIRRQQCLVTNVILCRPENNDIKTMLDKIRRYNKKEEKEAEKEGREPEFMKNPIECCAPRLEEELFGYTNFITLGGTATKAVTEVQASITAVRGAMMNLPGGESRRPRDVMPTVHPSFVLKQPRWRHVFRNDLQKAGRWFRGEAEWKPPEIIYNPSADELKTFLYAHACPSFDLETDGIECLTAKIRCVGVGISSKVMVCGFLGKDGYRKFYSPAEELKVKQVLIDWFKDPTRPKSSWNGGYYDRIVLESQWGVTVQGNIDGLIIHRNIESELPHGLAYAVSLYAEAPAWKTDRDGNKLSTGSESDEQLHEYCALDVALTNRIIPPITDQLRLRNSINLWREDQKIQSICADMHTVGMYVDQAKRLEEEKKLLKRRFELLAQIRDGIGNKDFNPGSVQQMRDLLFEKWGLYPPPELEKEALTSSGDPSTADIVLRYLLTDGTIPPERRQLIKLIRYYRKVQKILGTYVTKLRFSNVRVDDDLGWDDDEDWIDKETRNKYGTEKMGIVNPMTGRMYPGWNSAVAVTGRLSSSKPINAQNFPVPLRGLVCAAPGHVLVGADMDQVEVRVAASLWGIKKYLLAFQEGKDPHSMTAYMIFREEFCRAAGIDPKYFEQPGILQGAAYDEKGKFKGKGESKELRSLSKNVHFASQYKATTERAHKMIQGTEVDKEDGTTDLPYALMPLRKVREMRDRWLESVPEYEAGWQNEIDTWKRQGFLQEPVLFRRRDFLDGENPNELVNFRIQSSVASLMNIAIVELAEQIPRHKWGPGTGIIAQVHDWIGLEVPEEHAEEAAKILEGCMNRTHAAIPGVKFTAKADIGKRWNEV